MTSPYLEKIPSLFNFSTFSEAIPGEREAVIVIAPISNIKPLKLPSTELLRAEAITHQFSRIRYLAARYLLRSILAKWLGSDPQDISIALSALGKPFLAQYGMPHFSISHTEQLIGICFSSLPVGLDLEQERSLDVEALAKRFFTKEESIFLNQSSPPADFFRLWCCKEAAIKADGRGLGQLLASTRVITPIDEKAELAYVLIEGVSWITYPWLLSGGIHGSIAFREQPDVIHWCDFREAIV
jgi:phosphopantetheinyl transferase